MRRTAKEFLALFLLISSAATSVLADQIVAPPGLTPGLFQQKIDHFGALPGETFPQRYWIDSEYASGSDAPVLFHICGEADAETSGYFLNDYAINWAKSLGAHLVYLEHRYYGKSLPFPDLSSEHLRYLTLGNVLEDLADFQKQITQQQGWKGKWISIGGSYAGTLSALYRLNHPELVAGALASSAPMISGIGVLIDDPDEAVLSSTDPTENSDRPWVYEACTFLGFWQEEGAGRDAEIQIPSASFCKLLFGNVQMADYQNFNRNYDAPFLSSSPQAPSNILFTYGSEDVWTNTGLIQQKNSNTEITIHLIPGAMHMYDLLYSRTDDTDGTNDVNLDMEVNKARQLFVTLARSWLQSNN